jgi:primosomal protein N'
LATREVIERVGRRSGPREVGVARELARRHLVPFTTVASRLAPRNGLDDVPLDAGPLSLADIGAAAPVAERDLSRRRWLLLRAPLCDPAALAAQEAVRIHADTRAQVLVLAPTVASVTAVVSCFASGAARVDARAPQGAWAGFVAGTVPVAVGTRAAALYAPKKLGGVIVVDEQHAGHVESSQPYVHAREVAAARASASRCHLVLISPAPSAHALGSQVKVVAAGGGRDWPTVQLIDRGQLPPSQRLVPPQLRAAVAAAARDGITPVVLAERRQTTLRCARCRTLWPCLQEGCTPSSCRHAPDGSCPQCSSRTRIPVGFDAQRLAQLLPGTKSVSLAELARLRNVGLVVIFDVSPAVRAAEWFPGARASQLLTVAAEAAGAGGRLVVCSWDRPDGVVAQLCRRKDQQTVAQELWAYVKAQRLPPFSSLVTINVARVRPPRTDGWPGRVFGPRRTPTGEWELVVQASPEELAALAVQVERLRRGGKVRVQVL